MNQDRKVVEIWLTNAEHEDAVLRETLKPLYAQYKRDGYLVVVFESGIHRLYDKTESLLLHNRTALVQQKHNNAEGQSLTLC